MYKSAKTMKSIFMQELLKELETTKRDDLEELYFVFEETGNCAKNMYLLHHCDYLIYNCKNYLYYYAQLHDIPCIEEEYFLGHYGFIHDNPDDLKI